MKRTIDIMTTARAKGAELPGGWWGHCECCVECGSSMFTHDGYFCAKEGCAAQFKSTTNFIHGQRYIGPDLERAENIHHAFTVADALGKAKFGVKVEVLYDPAADVFEASFCSHCSRYAPERHLAVVAACEAALGIERGEAGV